MEEFDNNSDISSGSSSDSSSDSSNEQHHKKEFIDELCKMIPKDGNFCISPITVEIALAMAYQGVSGETAEKIGIALGVDNKEAAADKYKCDLESLEIVNHINQILVMKGFPVQVTFENVIEECFNSKIQPINFTNCKKATSDINQLVEEKTKNKIKNYISSDCLDESVRLMFVNALYFKGVWEKAFLEIDITIQPFFISKTESVDCEMMFISNYFKYASYHDQLHTEVLELPFKNKEYSLILIKYNTRYETVPDIDEVELSKIMENTCFKVKKMDVFVPKFKMDVTTDMKPFLEKMGLQAIFDSKIADFSDISDNSKSLHFSKFVQKICFEIDEKGVDVPVVPESRESLMTKASTFIVDEPFMFVLQANGKEKNTVLLVGKITNPFC